MVDGTVKFFNATKGFGFIEPENGSKDAFIHASILEQCGISPLADGQKVKYETETDARSGKMAVSKIELA